MSAHVTIGVDNGTTGTIAIIGPSGSLFEPMFTKEHSEGMAGKVIRRIDCDALEVWLRNNIDDPMGRAFAYIEKPFTGSPMMINTSVLAARSYEAVIVTLERMGIGYRQVTSKDWQKAVLGDVKGSPALKKASMLRGCQMYPQHAMAIRSHGDADGLLIAHYYHKTT
jgi:hypothetical protein